MKPERAESITMPDPRLVETFSHLVEHLQGFIRENRISYDEYHRALEFLVEAGKEGQIPLLLDVFLEATVDQVSHGGRPGTESGVEGPYYLPDAPMLNPPCVLPQRKDEPGEVLLFSGAVRSTDGAPLRGAVLDLWQCDATGRYSHFNFKDPKYNLRGRLKTDSEGRFEVRTVIPIPYEVPKAGPTGALLAALGRHAFRPAHIHVRLTDAGFEPLTTQLYFAGDPWLDSDVVGAVKKSLVVKLKKHDDRADLAKRNLKRPYFACSYDFALRPQAA